MTKTVDNFEKMGLNQTESLDLEKRMGHNIPQEVLDATTTVIAESGDPSLYHELLHMAHFPNDISNILQAISSNKKATSFFGFRPGFDDMRYAYDKGLYLSAFHDIALTLTLDGLSKYMDLGQQNSRLGDQNKRMDGTHHRRSKIILSQILKPYVSTDGVSTCLSVRDLRVMNEVLETGTTILTKEEVKTMQRDNRLYLTIPMIVDAAAYTRENFARGIAETAFITDVINAYATGKFDAARAIKEVQTTVKEIEAYCTTFLQQGKITPLPFNHEEMAARMAKKKNFPYLDYIKESFPKVYASIVSSGENNELERALKHKWYAKGVEAGLNASIKALDDKKITANYELVKAFETLATTIIGYRPFFKGK